VDIVVDNSYICQYCSKKFDNYFQLKSHMVIHKDAQVLAVKSSDYYEPEMYSTVYVQ